MNVTNDRETIALIFLGIEESFVTVDPSEDPIVESSVEQFMLLLEKVKSYAEPKIVITSSWGKKAENFEDLQKQLEKFPFQDRVVDAVSFRSSDDSRRVEAEKIRDWLFKNEEKWNIKSILAVGSFQASDQVRHRFPTTPTLFDKLDATDIPLTSYGFVFSHLDIDPSFYKLTTHPFSSNSLNHWEPAKECIVQ